MAFLSVPQLRTLLILSLWGILGMVFKYLELSFLSYITSIILLLLIHKASEQHCLDRKVNTSNKAVLITGCDTGFGNNLAKRLDAKGYHVFASCLFPDGAGASNLRETCSSNLQVLPLDVAKDESVRNALTFVKENLRSNVLWAVVNNAGISKGFSLDFSTIRHFQDTFDVNALGPVRVTKAFLPLLRESKGRVINVASIAGRLPGTDQCAYNMSKHALIALTECLRLEMVPWDIQVISIEPEMFRTQIMDGKNLVKRWEEEMKELDEDTRNYYGAEYLNEYKKCMLKLGNFASDNIHIVVDAMESAVSETNPRSVYKPTRNLLMVWIRFLLENMPATLHDKIYCTAQKFLGHP